MYIYIVIAVLVVVAASALVFFFRPMIPQGSKKYVNRRELRRIEIEYGQKDSDR
jgi:hypothetical protein